MNDRYSILTDEELQAFADARLPAARMAEIEAALAQDPALRQRIEAWRSQTAGLHALYDSLLDEPVPLRLHPQTLRRHLWQGRLLSLSRIAAMALLLAGAGATGWWLRGNETSTIEAAIERAATDAHLLYSSEKRHPVEVTAKDADHLSTWLSKRLDGQVVIPDLSEFDLALVGGRLLPSDHGPAAQLMYETTAGERVTLYIVPQRSHEETGYRFVSGEPVSLCYWTDGPFAFALVGPWDRDLMMSIATKAYDAYEL